MLDFHISFRFILTDPSRCYPMSCYPYGICVEDGEEAFWCYCMDMSWTQDYCNVNEDEMGRLSGSSWIKSTNGAYGKALYVIVLIASLVL